MEQTICVFGASTTWGAWDKEKVNYLKMPDLLDKEDLEDGLHPNSKGHQKLFLKVKDFLLKNKLL